MLGHLCGWTGEDHNSVLLIPEQVPSEFKSAMLPMTTVFHLVKDSPAWYRCLRAENPLLQMPLKDLILEYFQCHL